MSRRITDERLDAIETALRTDGPIPDKDFRDVVAALRDAYDQIDSAENRLSNALDGLGSAQGYISGALRVLGGGE